MPPYTIHNKTMRFVNSYDGPITQYYKIMYLENITHLLLGHTFKQPIKLIPHIVDLILGDCFNQTIVLTKRMMTFKSGEKFNKPIKLNKYIKNVTFGNDFNHQFDMPSNIIYLKIGFRFCHEIILGSKIKILVLRARNDLCLPKLPKNLQYLCCDSACNPILVLPKHMTRFEMTYHHGHILLPKFLSYAKFGDRKKHMCTIEYPIFELYLKVGEFSDIVDNLPNGMEIVTIFVRDENMVVNNLPCDADCSFDR